MQTSSSEGPGISRRTSDLALHCLAESRLAEGLATVQKNDLFEASCLGELTCRVLAPKGVAGFDI